MPIPPGPAHAARPVAGEVGEDLAGRLSPAVGPIVQDQDDLLIVGTGLVGVLHDQRGLQAVVELDACMWVEPVGARVGDREGVLECFTALHCGHRQPWNAVHVVAQRKSVPVHRGGLRQLIDQPDPEPVTGTDADLGPWHGPVVGPGRNDTPTEIHDRRCCGECPGHHVAGRESSGLGPGDRRRTGQHQGRGSAAEQLGADVSTAQRDCPDCTELEHPPTPQTHLAPALNWAHGCDWLCNAARRLVNSFSSISPRANRSANIC